MEKVSEPLLADGQYPNRSSKKAMEASIGDIINGTLKDAIKDHFQFSQRRREIYFTAAFARHLEYLFVPIALEVNSPAAFQRWRRENSPLPEFIADEQAWDILVPGLVHDLVYGFVYGPSKRINGLRGIISPRDLYAEVASSPFYQRLLADRAPYQPLYRVAIGAGEETELLLSDELVAGLLFFAADNPQLSIVGEGPTGRVDDLLDRYLEEQLLPYINEPYPIFRYTARIATPGRAETVTFPNAEFLQGLKTAAEWLGQPVGISSVLDHTTREELHLA